MSMHPNDLLNHCTTLIAQLLLFEHPTEMTVAHYFREQRALGPRERTIVAETAYSILRKKTLFTWLARTGSGSLERRLAILGFAAGQQSLLPILSFEEKQWFASCDQAVQSSIPDECIHNLPSWLADSLRSQRGAQFDATACALLQPAPLDIRVNTLLGKRESVRQTLAQEGLAATLTPYSPWGLRLQGKPNVHRLEIFRQGHIEVQDEGSQLLALLLDAKRAGMVVDFCAGAGGKTLALGATMRNHGHLYAFDISAHRLEQLKPRLARSGLSNVYPMVIENENDARIKKLTGKVDRVLVDAPCSGLGTLRRQPDLKWRQSSERIQAFSSMQSSILQQAARLLKPGGRLVYATCSLLPAENESVASDFSAQHHNMFLPLNAAKILQALKVKNAAQLCTSAENTAGIPAGQFLRLWPDSHGTDGFFAAVWQKKG